MVRDFPVQRACCVVGMDRSTYYRLLVDWAQRDAPVIAALTTLVAVKCRWGFWKCCDQLRLDGHLWNHKRLWRVYCQLRLNLASPHQEAAPGPSPSATDGGAAAQHCLGRGFHE